MFPAEDEVGGHDEQRRQHGGTGGEINGGVHHLLHAGGAEAVNYQHQEDEQELPPGGAYRHAVGVQLGGFLAVDTLRDFREVDFDRCGGPHHHAAEDGDKQNDADEAAHQRFRNVEVGAETGKDFHHSAGVGQVFSGDKDVNQQRT